MAETAAWRKKRAWPGAVLAVVCVAGMGAAGARAQEEVDAAEAGGPAGAGAYGKWWNACDNTGACAVYGAGGSQGVGVTLILRRAVEPAAPVKVLLVTDSPQAPTSAAAWRVLIDGKQVGAPRANPGRVMQAELSAADAQQLTARLAAGRELRLEGPGAGGSLGLSGAGAALKAMDEAQGRTGSASALITKGRAPMRPAPIYDVPVIQADARAAMTTISQPPKDAKRALRDCQKAFKSGVGDRQMRVYALPGEALLWTIPCGRRADLDYDLVMVSRSDGDKMHPALSGTPLPDLPRGVRNNVRFNAETGVLFELMTDKGLSDCGRATEWVWSNGAFTRLRERDMPYCVGLPVDLWPETYRARLAPARG